MLLGKSIEISEDGSLDKTLLYLLKLTLKHSGKSVTGLDKTLLHLLKLILKHSGI